MFVWNVHEASLKLSYVTVEEIHRMVIGYAEHYLFVTDGSHAVIVIMKYLCVCEKDSPKTEMFGKKTEEQWRISMSVSVPDRILPK